MVDDLYGTSDYGTTQPAAGGSTGKPPLRSSAAHMMPAANPFG